MLLAALLTPVPGDEVAVGVLMAKWATRQGLAAGSECRYHSVVGGQGRRGVGIGTGGYGYALHV